MAIPTYEEIIKDRYSELDDLNFSLSNTETGIEELEAEKERLIFKINNIEEEIRTLKENITYVKR